MSAVRMTYAAPDPLAAVPAPSDLRLVGLSAVPAVARLARLSFDPHFREAWNEAQIAAVLASAGGFLLMLGEDGLPLAFALCRQVLDEVELLLCATHPDLRRRGIGRQTMAAVIQESRRRGAVRLFLEVRTSNATAKAMYAACGLQAQGVRKAYYRTVTGEPVDAITLSLCLSQ